MSVTLPTYLALDEADALAAALPLLAAFTGTVDAAVRRTLLALATLRVDRSRRWQGQRYATDQVLEFPRKPAACAVWDWDAATQAAVVPQTVKLATLFEANSIADGTRDRISAAIDAGLTGQSTGGISEQYRQIIAGQAGVQALCPEADRLVADYRLKTGRIL